MTTIALALLIVAAGGFVLRLIIGPSLADRVIALDGLLIVVVATLAVHAAMSRRSWFVDVAVVIGLLGYVGTGVAARLIEYRRP